MEKKKKTTSLGCFLKFDDSTIVEMLPNEIMNQIFEHLMLIWRLVCRSVCQRRRHMVLAMPMPKDVWLCFVNEAEEGHLEVLRWVRSQGCPWNEDTCTSMSMIPQSVLLMINEMGSTTIGFKSSPT